MSQGSFLQILPDTQHEKGKSKTKLGLDAPRSLSLLSGSTHWLWDQRGSSRQFLRRWGCVGRKQFLLQQPRQPGWWGSPGPAVTHACWGLCTEYLTESSATPASKPPGNLQWESAESPSAHRGPVGHFFTCAQTQNCFGWVIKLFLSQSTFSPPWLSRDYSSALTSQNF